MAAASGAMHAADSVALCLVRDRIGDPILLYRLGSPVARALRPETDIDQEDVARALRPSCRSSPRAFWGGQ
jgi:hypothetical protein